jgi:hypothetical protein
MHNLLELNFRKVKWIKKQHTYLSKATKKFRVFLGHYKVPNVEFWNSNYTILNYCLHELLFIEFMNLWIILILFFGLMKKC